MLSLRDPADATNDLGRKGIAIKHVQATLAEISGKLAGAVRHNTLQTMLTPLVDPVYMLNKENRLRLRNYGINLSKNLDLSFASTAKAIREAEKAEGAEGAKGARTAAAPEAEDVWEGLPGMESDTKAV
jgi:non-canonical poly(A) RNA polymerase PAPD5/7